VQAESTEAAPAVKQHPAPLTPVCQGTDPTPELRSPKHTKGVEARTPPPPPVQPSDVIRQFWTLYPYPSTPSASKLRFRLAMAPSPAGSATVSVCVPSTLPVAS